MKNEKKKVFVGLSGGVDSSVAALKLLKEGYEVVGCFMRVWYPDWIECDWKKERQDSMRVCAHLGIPFREYDLQDEYKKFVIDYMVNEYRSGRTPNPDVMCNRHIKFDAFYKAAQADGADYIATGHYAQNCAEAICMSDDKSKDQTYFLWGIDKEYMNKILFPIGKFLKSEVREEAKKHGLFTAKKKDSQGLCFLGQIDMQDFLSHYIETQPGQVLNSQGEVIGEHEGSVFYTLGQRHGFTVKAQNEYSVPLYVLSKDVEANTITVGTEEERDEAFTVTKSTLIDTNWLIDPKEGEYMCRFRYRQPLRECKLTYESGIWNVEFAEPQSSVAPGQSLVIYTDNKLIGGGILDKTS